MIFRTNYGNYRVRVVCRRYCTGTLAILLESYNGEPIATLTTNLDNGVCAANGEEYAYVDTNNNPTAEEFIKENKLGTPTLIQSPSGYCVYPLYKFDLNRLREISK